MVIKQTQVQFSSVYIEVEMIAVCHANVDNDETEVGSAFSILKIAHDWQ